MKIFLDAGHGGTDSGAVNAITGLRESNINLDVTKRLGAILVKLGYDVKYARTTDVYVGLSTRASMANSWGANYFVSIHCNSSTNPQANGTETLCYKLGSTAALLATSIQKKLVAEIKLRDRGVKAQNVAVLRLTRMPAALAELAFISNPQESKLLADPAFREKCAIGISKGIVAFVGK